MDPNVAEWLNLLFRWAHVIAAVDARAGADT